MIDRSALALTVNTLTKKNFTLEIEGGITLSFHFDAKSFFHLLGLQYITDIPRVVSARNKASLVKQLLTDDVLFSQIQKSAHFGMIRRRVETLGKICDMLISDQCEIIVEFDPAKVPATKIKSKYLLYKRDMSNTYYLLGIATDGSGRYYPETYLVDSSKYYVANQTLLTCKIIVSEFTVGKSFKIT